jgi:predicted transcriptional regulator
LALYENTPSNRKRLDKFFYLGKIYSINIEIKPGELRMDESAELLIFFKALADANRLKIVGLLARQPYTVEQLAEILGLGASTVSHHLSKLSEAGLVSARAQSYYNFYRLENEQLESMARRLLSTEDLPAVPVQLEEGRYERKILRDYLLPDGRLKSIPSQRKKLMVILNYLLDFIEPGKIYNEIQVNEILARFHEDTAFLRRAMIGAKMMERDSNGSRYWRTEVQSSDPLP